MDPIFCEKFNNKSTTIRAANTKVFPAHIHVKPIQWIKGSKIPIKQHGRKSPTSNVAENARKRASKIPRRNVAGDLKQVHKTIPLGVSKTHSVLLFAKPIAPVKGSKIPIKNNVLKASCQHTGSASRVSKIPVFEGSTLHKRSTTTRIIKAAVVSKMHVIQAKVLRKGSKIPMRHKTGPRKNRPTCRPPSQMDDLDAFERRLDSIISWLSVVLEDGGSYSAE